MTIYFIFILLALLALLLARKSSGEKYFPLIIIIIYALSLAPSFNIPYLYDDIDLLSTLSIAIDSGKTFSWIMTPHNEHMLSFLKVFYFLFYKAFGVNPAPFHILTNIMCCGLLWITYSLLFLLTKNRYSAFFGITLLAATNLLDLAIFITVNSQIIFYLFFLILTLWSQHKFFKDQKPRWLAVAFLGTLLSPLCFALGILNIFYSFLFEKLCLNHHNKDKKNPLFIIFIAWSISTGIYFMNIENILVAKHYGDFQKASALHAFNFFDSMRYFASYFLFDLPRIFLNNKTFSLLFLGTLSLFALRNLRNIAWKKFIFFILLGMPISFLIFSFRIAWGEVFLSFSRYDVLPGFMLACLLTLLFDASIKNSVVLNKKAIRFLFLSTCLGLVLFGGIVRYQRASSIGKETKLTLKAFNKNFSLVFNEYFHAKPSAKKVFVRDEQLTFPFLKSLHTKKGLLVTITRTDRPYSFYATYLLPKEIKNKILWIDPSNRNLIENIQAEEDVDYLKIDPNMLLGLK